MNSHNSSCPLPFWWLSMATSPFIVSMVVFYFLTKLITETGKTSEELFRAERLPILNFPDLEHK